MGIWGIDLGGTKIEGIVLSAPNPESVLVRKRIDTEAHGGYDHILAQIKLLVDSIAASLGQHPESIGIGTPGTTDPKTGLLKNSNTVCLNGLPLRTDLESLLGIPVVMANDANCFALAEARMGIVTDAMPDARVVFGVIMGTGTGGGVVVDGRPIGGAHGIGGEWGHNFLDESGGPCYCGKIGCVERVISGTALQKYYNEQSGVTRSMKEIVSRARTGEDPFADLTLDRLIQFFGRAITVVVNIIDPDVIVVGGGLGNIDLLYSEAREVASKHIFNNTFDTPLLKPKLGDSAGVFGAALLDYSKWD